jgi:ADP-heptose:LPS heptosyltransferase
VIVYDNRNIHVGLKGKLKLIRDLNSRKFDLVMDLRDSFWSRFIKGIRWGMPFMPRLTQRYKKSHAVARYLDILSNHSVKTGSASPGIKLLPHETDFADEFLTKHGVDVCDLVIGIHPGGGWTYKLWDVEKFAILADELNRVYNAKLLIFAGDDEHKLQERMISLMKSPPITVRNLKLRELAALIQRCHLYIGNDTGPMHIAAAVGTQVIAIFGPTDAGRSGPYGSQHVVVSETVKCSPCHPGSNPGGCNRGRCLALESISPERAIRVAERILNEKTPESHGS